MSHISSTRDAVCGPHKDRAAAEKHQLALLLGACARHVSYIRNDFHSSLVAEILAIHVWVCGEVSLNLVGKARMQIAHHSEPFLSMHAMSGLCFSST